MPGKPTFVDVTGALLAAAALAGVLYLALFQHHEAAAGALIAVLSAATGYVFRGRVAPPADTPAPQPPAPASRPKEAP
jgi:hypothetical protein